MSKSPLIGEPEAAPVPARRQVFLVIACALCAPAALAQRRTWRIGVLEPRSQGIAGADVHSEVVRALRELGYVEGKNLAVIRRFADYERAGLAPLAAELVKERVDVIVTIGTAAVRAAQQATTTIPIIALTFADPVASGFAKSLARPGGNVTGLTTAGSTFVVKRLELLASVVPSAARVGYLMNPDNPGLEGTLAALQAAGRKTGKEVIGINARNPQEMWDAFETIAKARIAALMVADDPLLFDNAATIGELAVQSKLPTIFPYVAASDYTLLVYRATHRDFSRRAAALIDKVLKGAKPADLPIEEPTTFELVVNLRVARTLNLTIPRAVLLRADRVID